MAQSIHLQGIGQHAAKPAGELKPGDITVWNTGSMALVESVRPKGKQSLVAVLVTITASFAGHRGERVMRRDRLVAVTELTEWWLKRLPEKGLEAVAGCLDHPLCDMAVNILEARATAPGPASGLGYKHPDAPLEP